MQLHINNIVEFISLLVALLYYSSLKGSFMKWFLPFLVFIFLGEIYATYSAIVMKQNVVGVNYLIAIIESIFYGYIFYNLNSRIGIKKFIIFFIIVSVLGYILTYSFYRNSFPYFCINIITSGFLLATIALVYLYFKFIDDEESTSISESGFWIAFGVSLFYSGISVCLSLYEFIKNNQLSIFGENLLNIIPRFLSVVLYLSISIAIILCKHQKKISSLPS